MADLFDLVAERELKELPNYVFLIEYDKYQKKYWIGLKNKVTNQVVFTQKFDNNIKKLTEEQEELYIYKINKQFKFTEKENTFYLRERTKLNINFEKYLVKKDEQIEETKDFLEELQEDESLSDKEKICLYLEKKYVFYVDRSDPNLTIYVWNKNIWEPNAECIILNEMVEMFGKNKQKVKKEEIFDYLKGQGQNTNVKKKPPHLIPVLSGLFDITTKELIPHTPEYFYVNMIPHNYNSNAECPNWIKFEEEVHYEEDLDFIQEFFGYCLYTSYPTKAFLILIGNGYNGKTIELTIIKHIIGHKNNTTLSLQKLNDSPYGVAELYQKLTNISDDISSTKIKTTGNLKILSDGGEINARKIYGTHFDFIPYAKIINSCNEPPEFYDDTDALWKRLKAVTYPYKFVSNPEGDFEKLEKNSDNLIEELEKEQEGILNWLIEGLIRLKQNNFQFSYNKGTKEVREYYKAISNPVSAWVNTQLEYTGDDEDFIMKEDIYDHFISWIEENKIKNYPEENHFFKKLTGCDIKSYRPEVDKKKLKSRYVGYRISNKTTKRQSKITINGIKNNNSDTNNVNKSIDDYPCRIVDKCELCGNDCNGVQFTVKKYHKKLLCRKCHDEHTSQSVK